MRLPAGEAARKGRRPTTTTGVVTAYDAEVGLGEVTTADGCVVGFHCTQIADGSRDIPVGVPVDFVVLAGRGGRWEAGSLTRAPQAPRLPGPAPRRPGAAGRGPR